MSDPHDDPNATVRPDWQPLPEGVEVSIDVQVKLAPYSGQAVIYEWTIQGDASVRPEHVRITGWPTEYKPSPSADQIKAEQRAAWAERVRSLRRFKRLKRAGRTTAPDWTHNLRCFVLELQRDSGVVLLTSGCRCSACRTDVRSVVDIDGWPNSDLTRGPRRLTRAQRKAATAARLRRKSTP